MGTISEKLVYLNGTKQAIKQAINEDFEVIDNNSTFREYADEISSNNAKYKDLIPKETKNATNTLDISNSAGLDKALVTQYGNTYQEGEPTPDYPQEIQVVTGDNTINICGKNLFNKNGDIIYNKYIDASGNIVNETGNYYTNYYISINENNSYYISSNTNNSKRIAYYDSSKTFISRQLLNSTGGALTIPSNSKYVRISGFTNDMNIQLEKSNQATTYEPYQSQSYLINLGNIELCKIGDYQDYIRKSTGKNLCNIQQLQLMVNTSGKVISNSAFWNVIIDTRNINSIYISGNYGLLGDGVIRIGAFNEYPILDTQGTRITYSGNSALDTTNYNYVLLCFTPSSNHTIEEIKNSFMVNLGTTAIPYEPYGKVWYLNKQIGKVVLDGSENWSARAFPDNNYLSIKRTLQVGANGGYCDNFTNNNQYDVVEEHITLSKQWNEICFAILKSRLSTPDTTGFKSWLSTHNTTAYYVLATPTTTEITENNYPTLYNQLNNIKLFEGVNHINMTNESGLDVEFDITYYKDWKLD